MMLGSRKKGKKKEEACPSPVVVGLCEKVLKRHVYAIAPREKQEKKKKSKKEGGRKNNSMPGKGMSAVRDAVQSRNKPTSNIHTTAL